MSNFNLRNKPVNFFRVLLLNFALSPVTSTILIIETLISGIVPTIQILVFAEFISKVVTAISANGSIGSAFFYLVAVLLILAYQLLIPNLTHLVKVRHSSNVQKKLSVDVIEKCATLDYYHMETPETLDLISRIAANGEEKTIELYYTVLEAALLIARIVGLVGIIFVYSWGVALGILVFAVPLFALAAKAGKEVYDAEVEIAKHKRKYEYYTQLLIGREAADERALFGYTKNVNAKWEKQHAAFRKIINRTTIKNNIRLEGGSIITGVITFIAIAFLISAVFSGRLSSEMFISLVISIIELVEIMSFSFTEVINKFTNGAIFAKDMGIFFSLSEDPGATDLPQAPPISFESLEFRNVRFRYAEDLPYILDGVSFILKPGLHYAFVGENGAGKTTIVKLISGLYHNYEGEILLNGKSLTTYSSAEIKSLLSIAYQDFARYNISLEENIKLGALNSSSVDVTQVIKQVGLENAVSNLPNGIKTVLGRVKEGGVDMSGGEWQKIAIARNVVGNGSLSLLDEPTAALDPLAENRIYERFEKISKNRTTIFISHRLGSTKLADIVYVIDKGRIVESGTNAELLNKQGLYYEMYEAQRSWYV